LEKVIPMLGKKSQFLRLGAESFPMAGKNVRKSSKPWNVKYHSDLAESAAG